MNAREERKRIVREAAAIISEDIWSVLCNMDEYPPTDDFLQLAENLIPDTLHSFLHEIIVIFKRGKADEWKKSVK